MADVLSLWLFLFGVWPLSHPQHDTFTNPLTLLDLGLHLAGAVWVWHLKGERIRLAWFVYRKGLPVDMKYPDGTHFERKV